MQVYRPDVAAWISCSKLGLHGRHRAVWIPTMHTVPVLIVWFIKNCFGSHSILWIGSCFGAFSDLSTAHDPLQKARPILSTLWLQFQCSYCLNSIL